MMQFIETLYADPLLKFLANTTMKSLVIFAVAGLFVCCLRRKSAAVRGFVWSMAMVGCLIVPLFSFLLPKWEVNVLPEMPIRTEIYRLADNTQPATTPVSIAPIQSPSETVSPTQVTPTPSQPKPVSIESSIHTTMHWTDWVALAWVGIGLLLLVRLIVGIGAVWYISVRSNDFSSSIKQLHPDWNRQISVRLNNRITVPMVWGFFRPVILLPIGADNWQTERLRAVLLHELAHIKRWDWVMQTITQVACAVYWFNPLVWFAARWMRIEAEQASDDQVLNAGYQPTDYAQHLLDVVRNVKVASFASRAAVAMVRPSKIEERLRTVLTKNLNRHPVTKIAMGIGLLVFTCFAIPMGAMRLAQAVNPEETLSQQILTASKAQPTPEELLPKPGVYMHGQETGLEKYRQDWEGNLERCEEFINTYPNSNQFDAVWFEKLNYLFGLQRYPEFDVSAEAFLSTKSTSKYTDRLRRFRVYRFMDEGKYDQALAELDRIIDPALLPEVYQRKADVYDKMGNWEKVDEFNLLWAERILGKPAPKFSHTSIDGTPVSLQALRGKVVVLYHWSTREELTVGMIPILKRLHEMYRDNPDFVLINVCTRSSKAEMTQFIEKHTMPGIHLLLEPEVVPPRLGVIHLLNHLPSYVILDKTGIIRESTDIYSEGNFKLEHLVTAFLAEDPNVNRERIIPQVNQFLAYSYLRKGQREKSIAEYEKMLAFTPNNLDIMMNIFNLEMFPSARVALMNRAYDRVLELHQLNQTSPEFSLDMHYYSLELVRLFAEQGDPEKTWKLFQIAVAYDRIGTINSARENKERFAVIQDMPEFQKLLAEEPPQKPNETRPDEPANTEQIDKNVEICKQQLLEIGKAVQAYQKEHGDFPEWLSDLHPEYLSDANLLLCPADQRGGEPVFSGNADPKMPVSYGYQFHPEYQEGTQLNRVVYGDVIPLARCRHHTNQEFECLNLGFSFKVYPSSGVWQNTPWEMYENAEEAITALEAGLHQKQNNVNHFDLYLSFVRHYVKIGQEKDAESLLNHFKLKNLTIQPDDFQANFYLDDMLAAMKRNQDALEVFKKLEEQEPDARNVLQKLAKIHVELGNAELAAAYQRKTDPMSELVGKVMPDFSATDLGGKPISLQQYRGKVVLLDFWAVWCGPCIAQMPIVKKVYDTYKDQGFDIIGVSLDTEEKPLRSYLKENDIQWRQIFSGQGWDSPLARRFDIHAIPAPWLIARDGTLISRKAGAASLERRVIEALKDTPPNQPQPTGKAGPNFDENLKAFGPDLGRIPTESAEVLIQKPSEDINETQHEKNIEVCTQNLVTIGKAIQAYQKEHGDFPEWLSNLHPQYLPDANILLCPADEHSGKPYFLINTDPKMSVSYDYQFHPRYQDTKTEERLMYGDVLPLVRCRHHTNQMFECLNLSFAFKIYWSSGVYKPDEMYETTEEAIEALEKGLQRETDNEQFFHVYRTLVHLYIEVGREKDAEHLINRFKSIIKPDDLSAHFVLGMMLEMANQHQEMLKVFEKLEERYPDDHDVLDELARIHEKLGNTELAEEYRKKADPMSELIGKVVPNFSATDLDGKPISLQQYRGKVVLLDFWAVWCGPCLTEIPNVKRVYDTYKDQGFDIIGVSLDTDETRLRNYLKKNNISWRQIFSGQKWKSPLAQQYHIRSIPAPWLIARDGTLISREARGVKLERLVAEALGGKTENE